jgi:hypothetical protein
MLQSARSSLRDLAFTTTLKGLSTIQHNAFVLWRKLQILAYKYHSNTGAPLSPLQVTVERTVCTTDLVDTVFYGLHVVHCINTVGDAGKTIRYNIRETGFFFGLYSDSIISTTCSVG